MSRKKEVLTAAGSGIEVEVSEGPTGWDIFGRIIAGGALLGFVLYLGCSTGDYFVKLNQDIKNLKQAAAIALRMHDADVNYFDIRIDRYKDWLYELEGRLSALEAHCGKK